MWDRVTALCSTSCHVRPPLILTFLVHDFQCTFLISVLMYTSIMWLPCTALVLVMFSVIISLYSYSLSVSHMGFDTIELFCSLL